MGDLRLSDFASVFLESDPDSASLFAPLPASLAASSADVSRPPRTRGPYNCSHCGMKKRDHAGKKCPTVQQAFQQLPASGEGAIFNDIPVGPIQTFLDKRYRWDCICEHMFVDVESEVAVCGGCGMRRQIRAEAKKRSRTFTCKSCKQGKRSIHANRTCHACGRIYHLACIEKWGNGDAFQCVCERDDKLEGVPFLPESGPPLVLSAPDDGMSRGGSSSSLSAASTATCDTVLPATGSEVEPLYVAHRRWQTETETETEARLEVQYSPL